MARSPAAGAHKKDYGTHQLQQEIGKDLKQLRELAARIHIGTLDPEKNVKASPGHLFIRETDPGQLYFKETGHEKTGWQQLEGGGGAAPAAASLQVFPYVKEQQATADERWIRIRGNLTSGVSPITALDAFLVAPYAGRLSKWTVNRFTATGGDTDDEVFRMYVNGSQVATQSLTITNGSIVTLSLAGTVTFAEEDRIAFSVQPSVGGQPDIRGAIVLEFNV